MQLRGGFGGRGNRGLPPAAGKEWDARARGWGDGGDSFADGGEREVCAEDGGSNAKWRRDEGGAKKRDLKLELEGDLGFCGVGAG